MADDLELERALETQRRKLLRLLTGLFAAVEFLSVGSANRKLPQWFLSLSLYILRRAEAAAQCLIIVESRVLAQNGCGPVDCAYQSPLPRKQDKKDRSRRERVSVPDGERLRRRIRALQDVLADLSQHALRKKRFDAKRGAKCSGKSARPRGHDHHEIYCDPLRREPMVPRVERPPDKVPTLILFDLTNSLPVSRWETNVFV